MHARVLLVDLGRSEQESVQIKVSYFCAVDAIILFKRALRRFAALR